MRHLNFLDGLRAISILMVLGFHGMGPVSALLPAGWLGVNIFFVISGFLITSLLLREKLETGKISFAKFYMRRFLRLMPVYWTYLLVVLVIYWKASPHMLSAFGIAGAYMSDYDIALGWGHILGSGYESTWSLAVEEKFYLFWPAIVAVLGLRSRYFAIVSIALCELFKLYLVSQHAIATQPYRILGGFDTHVDELMFGCLAAHIMQSAKGSQFIGRIATNFVSIAVLILFGYLWATTPYPTAVIKISSQMWFNAARVPAICLLAGVLIMLCAANERLLIARVLSLPPLRWVGRLSYSLYLWHGHVIWQMEKTGLGHWITHNPYKRELLNFGTALGVAAVSYYGIEKPFLKLKKRFEFKGAETTEASSTTAVAERSETRELALSASKPE